MRITRRYTRHAEGAVLIECGDTKVVCTASVLEKQPPHLKGTPGGWVTAEYGMLPRSTGTRTDREAARGRQSGRTQEIQRLIGRSLRAVTDLGRMGEGSITVDCDVLQADAGTRTASITGGYIALALALRASEEQGLGASEVLTDSVAAVGTGIVAGAPLLDLCYDEDAEAEVDFNVVMTGSGRLVEIQGTAEGEPFSREQLDGMVDLAAVGIDRLTTVQLEAAGSA